MRKSFTDKLARLRTLIVLNEARIKADPLPALRDASEEMVRLREVFDQVHRALSPEPVFEFAEKHNIRPPNVNGEALIRCNAAQKVLDDYLRGK